MGGKEKGTIQKQDQGRGYCTSPSRVTSVKAMGWKDGGRSNQLRTGILVWLGKPLRKTGIQEGCKLRGGVAERLARYPASTDEDQSFHVTAKWRQMVAKAQENESCGWLARDCRGGEGRSGLQALPVKCLR